jgi:hypothetical protein
MSVPILIGRKGKRRQEFIGRHNLARRIRAMHKDLKREAAKSKHRIARTPNSQRPRGI